MEEGLIVGGWFSASVMEGGREERGEREIRSMETERSHLETRERERERARERAGGGGGGVGLGQHVEPT